MNAEVFYAIGLVFVVVGIIIIILAVILASMGNKGHGKVKSAGIILVGPIPIIFGIEKKSVKTVLRLALALTITLVIALVIYYWILR